MTSLDIFAKTKILLDRYNQYHQGNQLQLCFSSVAPVTPAKSMVLLAYLAKTESLLESQSHCNEQATFYWDLLVAKGDDVPLATATLYSLAEALKQLLMQRSHHDFGLTNSISSRSYPSFSLLQDKESGLPLETHLAARLSWQVAYDVAYVDDIDGMAGEVQARLLVRT